MVVTMTTINFRNLVLELTELCISDDFDQAQEVLTMRERHYCTQSKSIMLDATQTGTAGETSPASQLPAELKRQADLIHNPKMLSTAVRYYALSIVRFGERDVMDLRVSDLATRVVPSCGSIHQHRRN